MEASYILYANVLVIPAGKVAVWQSSFLKDSKHNTTYLRSLVTTCLNAYSHAYILITRIPVITSFIIRTRLSVTCADLNLGGRGKEGGEEGRRDGERKEEDEYRIIQCSLGDTHALSLSLSHTPQFTKDTGKKYLQRDLENDKSHGQEGGPANLVVHQVGKDSKMQWTDP